MERCEEMHGRILRLFSPNYITKHRYDLSLRCSKGQCSNCLFVDAWNHDNEGK
jgi:hypothetical protein